MRTVEPVSGRCIGSDEEVTGVLEVSVDVDPAFVVALSDNLIMTRSSVI